MTTHPRFIDSKLISAPGGNPHCHLLPRGTASASQCLAATEAAVTACDAEARARANVVIVCLEPCLARPALLVMIWPSSIF
jgi:hypothetical protein